MLKIKANNLRKTKIMIKIKINRKNNLKKMICTRFISFIVFISDITCFNPITVRLEGIISSFSVGYLSFILFLIEIFITSYGLLSLAGLLSLIFGSLF